MDTWTLLKRELNYFGICLLDHRQCRIYTNNTFSKSQGIIKTIRRNNVVIKSYKKAFLDLWGETTDLLSYQNISSEIIDDKIIKLFIFSLKDLSKFVLCFEELSGSKFEKVIARSLNRDITTFSKEQIYKLPDYKILMDWVHRSISRLLYINKLLYAAILGPKRVSQYNVKTARGISGPWAHLDLPMEERAFPFGFGLRAREKGKQKQRRYRQGLENYNNDGRVGEGHYWRELRNEPFDWMDRNFEDPYPSRTLLSR